MMSFFIKNTLSLVLSSKFRGIFQNIFFTEHFTSILLEKRKWSNIYIDKNNLD